MWVLGIACAELLSALVVFHPTVNTIVALTIAVVFFVCSIFRPSFSLTVVAVELLIGSMGGLFRAFGDAQNNGGVSVRVLLFVAFIAGWLIWSLRSKTYRAWRSFLVGRTPYLILGVVVLYAVVMGWAMNRHAFVLADANAWGMWLMLLPVLDLVRNRREELSLTVVPAIIASLLWLPMKTILLFYFFSHGFAERWHETVYLWIRRTGNGEVTRVIGSTFRVFMQSHIYGLIVAVGGLTWLTLAERGRGAGRNVRRLVLVVSVLSLAEIVISLSRSFWIGLVASLFICAIYILRRKGGLIWKWTFRLGFMGFCAIALVGAALWFPVPKSSGSLAGLFESRMNLGESAARSRWQLLPVLWEKVSEHAIVGSGFGAALTYESKDPRVVASTGGSYTTFAFEWGWLDFWFKFGVFGPVVMLLILVQCGRRVWRMSLTEDIRFVAVLGIVALAIVHFFTPYLNHPLGFGVLIAIEGVIESRKHVLVS